MFRYISGRHYFGTNKLGSELELGWRWGNNLIGNSKTIENSSLIENNTSFENMANCNSGTHTAIRHPDLLFGRKTGILKLDNSQFHL